MKRIIDLALLVSVAQCVYAVSDAEVQNKPEAPKAEPVARVEPVKAEPVKKARAAVETNDASVNMAKVKETPSFMSRSKAVEAEYRKKLMELQSQEQAIQQDVKAGRISESELYGKSQQFEYEFRKAQEAVQKSAMELEKLVDEIISAILKEEGWDGCQVQYFSYVNPKRDITDRVVARLEEKLKVEKSAEQFKKSNAPVADSKAVAKKTSTPAVQSKPGVKPAPKKAKA